MADEGKRNFTVNLKLNPYGEFKGKVAPLWFEKRPKLKARVKEIPIKKTIELDPKKWKQKTLEQGVYAVARYELARFATALNALQKDIDKAIPAKQQKAKDFIKTNKNDSKEVDASLSNAEKKVEKLYAAISKTITEKVISALDEAGADKGDNAKALAAGKAALAKFASIDTRFIFSQPTETVTSIFDELSADLKEYGDDSPELFKGALRFVEDCQKKFEGEARTTLNVVKFLMSQGAKMAKDKGSHQKLQNIGKEIQSINSTLSGVSKDIETFEAELDGAAAFLKKAKATADTTKTTGRAFEKGKNKMQKFMNAADARVKKIAKDFSAVQKEMKKK